MARYLLDTDTLIDFSKGHEPVTSRLSQMIAAGDDLGVCGINVAEFYTGLPPDQRPTWDAFFAALSYWPMTRAAATMAGQYRYNAARQGLHLAMSDSLVAAVALEQQATVVTNNAKDYPMPGIALLSLRT